MPVTELANRPTDIMPNSSTFDAKNTHVGASRNGSIHLSDRLKSE